MPKKDGTKGTHVSRACANCQKAHVGCDSSRPCKRCVKLGKTETCFDVEQKKRGWRKGRPRSNKKVSRSGESGEESSDDEHSPPTSGFANMEINARDFGSSPLNSENTLLSSPIFQQQQQPLSLQPTKQPQYSPQQQKLQLPKNESPTSAVFPCMYPMPSTGDDLSKLDQDSIYISFRMNGMIYDVKNSLKIIGIPPSELLGRDFFQAIHISDIDIVRKVIELVKGLEDNTFQLLFRLKTRDLNFVWIEGKGKLIRDPATQGYYVELSGPLYNVKKVSEQEKIDLGSFTMRSSHDGQCLDITEGVNVSLGYTKQEMKGSWIMTIVHPVDLSIMHSAQSKLLEKDGSECSIRIRVKSKTGEYLWMETNARTVRNPLTRLVESVICNFRPIPLVEAMGLEKGYATCVKVTESPDFSDKKLVERLIAENQGLREENRRIISYQIENENLRNHLKALQIKLDESATSDDDFSIDEIPIDWLHDTINQNVA